MTSLHIPFGASQNQPSQFKRAADAYSMDTISEAPDSPITKRQSFDKSSIDRASFNKTKQIENYSEQLLLTIHATELLSPDNTEISNDSPLLSPLKKGLRLKHEMDLNQRASPAKSEILGCSLQFDHNQHLELQGTNTKSVQGNIMKGIKLPKLGSRRNLISRVKKLSKKLDSNHQEHLPKAVDVIRKNQILKQLTPLADEEIPDQVMTEYKFLLSSDYQENQTISQQSHKSINPKVRSSLKVKQPHLNNKLSDIISNQSAISSKVTEEGYVRTDQSLIVISKANLRGSMTDEINDVFVNKNGESSRYSNQNLTQKLSQNLQKSSASKQVKTNPQSGTSDINENHSVRNQWKIQKAMSQPPSLSTRNLILQKTNQSTKNLCSIRTPGLPPKRRLIDSSKTVNFSCAKPSTRHKSFGQTLSREMMPKRKMSSQSRGVIETKSFKSTKSFGIKKINDYVILRQIGVGMMGKVMMCLKPAESASESDLTFAMKIIKKTKIYASPHKKNQTNVLNELDVMRKLDHPNIVKLHEVIDSSESDKLYLIMDYISGSTLQQVVDGLSDHERLPIDRVWKWTRGVVSALTYCHEESSIIHRDVKPENIMLDKDDKAYLVDFGVSTLFEGDDDRLKGTAGSVRFFAPEIVRTGQKDKQVFGRKTDVWALAVTLYYLVTKRFPFTATSIPGIQQQLLDDEPDFSLIEDAKLVDLLTHMFIKDPLKRPAMGEIALHPWLSKDGADPLELYYNKEATEQEETNQESESETEERKSSQEGRSLSNLEITRKRVELSRADSIHLSLKQDNCSEVSFSSDEEV